MLRKETFLIDELVIAVDDGSYLVEVDRNEKCDGTDNFQDLPAWIFESRYAIWLSAGEAPVRIRALEGEQIKKELMTRFAIS
jgi:hypothetical protein